MLQLFPSLCVEEVGEPRVVTADVLGRNIRTMRDFVVTTLKQQSADPSSITPESEAVQKIEKEANAELAAFLQHLHDLGRGTHVAEMDGAEA